MNVPCVLITTEKERLEGAEGAGAQQVSGPYSGNSSVRWERVKPGLGGRGREFLSSPGWIEVVDLIDAGGWAFLWDHSFLYQSTSSTS